MTTYTVPVTGTLTLDVDNPDAYTAESDALLAAAAFEGRSFKLAARVDGPRARLKLLTSPDGPATRQPDLVRIAADLRYVSRYVQELDNRRGSYVAERADALIDSVLEALGVGDADA